MMWVCQVVWHLELISEPGEMQLNKRDFKSIFLYRNEEVFDQRIKSEYQYKKANIDIYRYLNQHILSQEIIDM